MLTNAVITGDVVGSTRLAKAVFSKLLKKLETVLAPYPHEFFRGDSFQVVLKPAEDAYALVLKLRLEAMKLDTKSTLPVSDIRASIGLGPVKTPVRNLRTASDEAFVLSGRLLEQMKPSSRLLIAGPEQNTTANTGLRVLANFTDYIFERMTAKQAAVAYELLQQKTQTEAAKTLKKSQATIHKHAQAAGWPELENLVNDYKFFAAAIIL